jgi:hypothetical protein
LILGPGNQTTVLNAGEIFQIVSADDEIALATFNGLHFGKVSQTATKLEWISSKVFFRDRLISQICQVGPSWFVVAEYSQPGYFLIDRNTEEQISITDSGPGHNSGCTDLLLLSTRYILACNRF